MSGMYPPTKPESGNPAVLVEHIVRYRDGGAATYLKQLRDELTRCPGELGEPGATTGHLRWRLLRDGVAGDESLLIAADGWLGMDQHYNQATDYIVVTRVGDILVVLVDAGWENFSSDGPERVNAAASEAVQLVRRVYS